MVARVSGIRVQHMAARAAQGRAAWGVFIDTRIGGTRLARAKFWTAEADAERCYAAAVVEVTRLRDEAEAQARLKAALDVPALPRAPKGTALFGSVAVRWMEEYVREMCAPATYRHYQHLLNKHLLPTMKTWPVNDETFTPQRLKQLLKTDLLKASVRLPTRVACQRLLSACLGWAKAELPPKQLTSVAEKFGQLYIRDVSEKGVKLTQEPNPMTRVQVESFLAWQLKHHPEMYEWFLWSVDEGSRVGEVAALRWTKIDLDRGKAHIVATYSESQRWMELRAGDRDGLGEKDTKTHRSNQYIDLSPRVVT